MVGRSHQVLVVLVTCPSRRSALQVAETLIARRLAACVNIVPGVTSIYRWQGKTERATEMLLVIKTTRPVFGRMKKAILAVHPYDVPEIIAMPVERGHQAYLGWVVQSTQTVRPPQ